MESGCPASRRLTCRSKSFCLAAATLTKPSNGAITNTSLPTSTVTSWARRRPKPPPTRSRKREPSTQGKGVIMRDQTRNIETFKVGASTRVNEFDFHKHQGEMHEHHTNEHERSFGKAETK